MAAPRSDLPLGALPEDSVLSGYPPPRSVSASEVMAAVSASGRHFVVLDDDPTGTQSVSGLAVLTAWDVEDIRWAMRQEPKTFYVLTNTRALAPAQVEHRNQEVAAALAAAAGADNADFVVASRSDSTLRGYYPLEVDVLSEALASAGRRRPDGVLIAPAYIEAGRLTVGSVHWARGPGGLLPVGLSEFAQDATFGYRSSDLRDYVEEKTGGRWAAGDVARVSLHDIRSGGPAWVAEVLGRLRHGRPVVIDATCDDDLRVVALGALLAEAAGASLIYRVGPSFVRARAGLSASPPLSASSIRAITDRPGAGQHGLVVTGSHVPRTSRQLEGLSAVAGLAHVELNVPKLLGPDRREEVLATAAEATVAALAVSDVVLATSRQLVTGDGPAASLAIAQAVSSALVGVVQSVLSRVQPRWLVGKGGITSSDLVTEALGARRAWVRGTLLPGIISLWQPIDGAFAGMPYVVFAGNVGDDDALATVVSKLRGSS